MSNAGQSSFNRRKGPGIAPGGGEGPRVPEADGNPVPVTFITAHAVLGGAESVLQTLVTRLDPGWVAGIVILQDGPLATEIRALGFEIVIIPTASRAGILTSAARLRRVLREQQPAVVHANGIKATLVAGLALAGRRTPLLWMKHDTAGDGWLARLAALRTDLIVGVSDTVLVTFSGRLRGRATTIYNGVPDRDVDRDAARQLVQGVLGIASGVQVVALAGRVCVGKGQHELLAAAPAILASRPNTCFAFVGGEDPAFPGHLDRLRAQAEDLGITAAVRFVGRRRDVVEFMAGCDIVAAPSVLDGAYGWREGFGLVGVEALQVGTPVVGYASGALPEVLGDAAVLVAEGDRAELAAQIALLLEDPARRTLLAARGQARVAERFSEERSLSALRERYRTLARSRR